jgi:DNA-binding SARP family transcriptional activator/ABC-type branched-subunit amino acid transport system substrate-binding protein/DNA-binding beta-propeller fold protein YncE
MPANGRQEEGKIGAVVLISLAGRVSITADGTSTDDDRFPGRQGRLVFAYLAREYGRPVPRDELAEAVWGDGPPVTWEKALTVIVSKLRSLLEECGLEGRTALTSAFGCYRLELPIGSTVDVLEARRAVADLAASREEIEVAATIAGRPFLPGEQGEWVEGERRELADLHVRALERLADERLGAGDHAEAARWAQQLVELEPYRESGYRRLMTVHAAAGNRADALRVYERCRRFLADELGAYPSPETEAIYRRLLAETSPEPDHVDEPALASVTPRFGPAIGSRRASLLVGVGVLLGAAALAAFLAFHGDTEPSVLAPDSVGVIDAKTHRVVAQFPIAGGPSRLVAGSRSVWVGSDEAGTLSAVDPQTHTVSRLVSTGGFPSDLAGGADAVWVVDGKSGLLMKVDPDYGTVVGRLRVAPRNLLYNPSREDLDPTAVASGMGSIWVTDGSRRLTRVDPQSVRILDRIDLGSPLNGVAVGAGGIWVVSGTSARAIRLNRRGHVTGLIPIVSSPGFQSPYPLAVAAGEGFVYVLNGNTATVTKIDPDQRIVEATIPVGIDRRPVSLAVGEGAAWVANNDGTVARIDASTNTREVIQLGRRLRDVQLVDGAVWVTAGVGSSPTAAPDAGVTASRVRALPTSSCSPIYFEGGDQPQYLIASDLPLQGVARTLTTQVGNAIEFVLRRHRFRAGRYGVGYQSCDDSTAQLGYPSTARCAANARAYARNGSVIGVIGPFTSLCSLIELPIVNRAPAGPVAMISFSNTYVGLTHSAPGAAPGEPEELYPTGIRNYARIVAADDFQAAANAILAKQLGVREALVVYDEQPYSTGIAAGFRRAAHNLGIAVVGTVDFDFEKRLSVVNRLRLTRPDAVFLAVGGLGEPAVGVLIKDLRAQFGPGLKIIAPDSFADFASLVRMAGTAAEGMTVSLPGVPTERLPSVGKAFVAAFREEIGQQPMQQSVYAAQATEVLLDAIAKSDGTRASVVAELFETKVTNGLLGSFSIDPRGDTTASPVTIYRIVRGAPRILRVITPPRRLTR